MATMDSPQLKSPPATPMLYAHTTFGDRGLTIDGVALADIAAEHSTPTFVYSIPRVIEKFRGIRDSFAENLDESSPLSIHFSMKANPSSAIIRALVAEGAGIDCVSAGEVHKALHFGCPADHIVFAGVGKSPEEVDFAVARRVGWFNVENEDELGHIQRACEKHGVEKTNVALRVNPNVEANTHPSIATGHGGAKFGLPIDVCERLLKAPEKYPRLHFGGLHAHIGSQLGDVQPTVEAITRVVKLAGANPTVKALNIGGGFPVQYKPDFAGEAAVSPLMPTAANFAAAVAPVVKGFHVMLEPGRSIAADAGVLLTRSLYRKDQANMTMLIVDASMVEVMRPALYGAYHDVVPVETAPALENTIMTTIVGPVCESTDVINKGVSLQESVVRPEALFAVMTCGAYCSSMAGNYNARPLCAEVAITARGEYKLCRRRQTFDDLVKDEILE